MYMVPFDVLFTDTNVAQPDILFVSREREHIVTSRQRAGSAGPHRGDPVAVVVHEGLAGQAGTVRRARRTGVLDSRSSQQDSVRPAAPGWCAGDRADSYRRRYGDVHGSRRVQREAWTASSRRVSLTRYCTGLSVIQISGEYGISRYSPLSRESTVRGRISHPSPLPQGRPFGIPGTTANYPVAVRL